MRTSESLPNPVVTPINDGITRRYKFLRQLRADAAVRAAAWGENLNCLPIVRHGGDLRKRDAFTLQFHSGSLIGKR